MIIIIIKTDSQKILTDSHTHTESDVRGEVKDEEDRNVDKLARDIIHDKEREGRWMVKITTQ